MSRHKLPLSIVLVGLAATIGGVAFKLNHLAGAHTLTNIGMAIMVAGLLLWALRLVIRT